MSRPRSVEEGALPHQAWSRRTHWSRKAAQARRGLEGKRPELPHDYVLPQSLQDQSRYLPLTVEGLERDVKTAARFRRRGGGNSSCGCGERAGPVPPEGELAAVEEIEEVTEEEDKSAADTDAALAAAPWRRGVAEADAARPAAAAVPLPRWGAPERKPARTRPYGPFRRKREEERTHPRLRRASGHPRGAPGQRLGEPHHSPTRHGLPALEHDIHPSARDTHGRVTPHRETRKEFRRS